MFISKFARRSIAMLLSLALCLSFCMPILAAEADSVSLQLSESSLIVSDADQTVTLDIVTVEEVSVDSLMYTVEVPDGWSVAQPTMPEGITGETWTDNMLIWYSSTTDVTGLTNLGSLVITVPANTAAATYEIKVTGFDASANAEYWVEQADYSTTLIIEEVAPEAPSDDPYTAEITASTDTVVNGDTILVNVNVDGTVGKFNSAMIVVEYDPDYMSFVSGVCNQTMGKEDVAADFEDDGTGLVTIVDYGEELTAGEAVYTLTFTANDGGYAEVSMNASFSTAEHAEEEDLIAAEEIEHLDVTINHKVTVNGSAEGSVTPSGTDSYNVTINGYNPNYNYTVTAKVDGEEVKVVDNGDGTFTVENVTDDLVITYELGEAKSYAVNWIGDLDGIDTTVKSATYGENFSVSLPIRKEPTQTEAGIDYLATISVGNKVLHTLSSGQSYTVEGTEITDVITINVEQISTPALGADDITVTVTGSDVKIDGTDSNWAVVDPGTDITLVLTPELGFEYTVTVGDGEPKTFDENNKFTFTAEEDVTVTVQKTVSTIYANVEEYLTLDADVSAGTMWLVTITPDEAGSQLEDKVYSFDGKNMFWSEEYKAYCYLVIAATKEDVDLTLIKIVGGRATEVDYGMDVNMSRTEDVNDAQLVWNMYTIKYTDFETITVEKFLRADVNADKTVSTLDAQAIIEYLM